MTTDSTVRTSLLNTAFRMALGMSVVMSPAYADILRGGGGGTAGATPPAAAGPPAGGNTPATTNQARTNAKDLLARTTQSLNAVRAMQDAVYDEPSAVRALGARVRYENACGGGPDTSAG